MKIYIIRKPGTNEVYIGQTKLELKTRLQKHFTKQKIQSKIKIYQWLDSTCTIELLEEFESKTIDIIKEMFYVKYYEELGMIIMNTNKGQKILDNNYHKKYSSKRIIQRKKHNSNRHPDYINWVSKIAQKAKKEGLSSKEYRLKYSIPDYTGQKKLL